MILTVAVLALQFGPIGVQLLMGAGHILSPRTVPQVKFTLNRNFILMATWWPGFRLGGQWSRAPIEPTLSMESLVTVKC